MISDKRGISEVIVTVLILLLIIAAVAILWVVISGFIKSSTERISFGVNTISLEIVENSLKYKPSGDLELRVKRSPGEGNLSSVKVLIEDESGQQASYNYVQTISELETRNVIVPASSISSLGLISKVSIAPVVKGDSGKEYPGDVIDDIAPGKGFVSSEGLVLYMPFDGDAKDKSGNGNDGTVTNAVLTNGKIGQAYSFDGNGDYIQITAMKGLSAQQVSIVAWVYPTAYNTATGYNYIINKPESNGYTLYGPMSSGQTYFKVIAESPSQTLTLNTNWYHLVGVYNTTTRIIYKDTVKLSNPLAATTLANTGDLFISGGVPSSFNGKIDEVRIYNRALSDKDVQYLYKYG